MDLTPLISPSKARLHLARAQDWAYVDAWLASKYHPSSAPPFERNEETLAALLALGKLNESADEEKEAFGEVARGALDELEAVQREDPDMEMLSSLEKNLTRQGRTHLDLLGSLSVTLGGVYTPLAMADNIVALTASEMDLVQKGQRLDTLESSLIRELLSLKEQLSEVQGEGFQAPMDIFQRTNEWTRSTKALNTSLVEFKDKLSSLGKANAPALGVPQVVEDEKNILDIRNTVDALESRVNAFHNLPADHELAKAEVERLRRELASLQRKRDMMFEALV